MTNVAATLPDCDGDVRWRKWEARGVENDRRTATRMRRLMLAFGTALAVWLSVQLS